MAYYYGCYIHEKKCDCLGYKCEETDSMHDIKFRHYAKVQLISQIKDIQLHKPSLLIRCRHFMT